MATVVLGRIRALMTASNVWWSDRRQVKDKCPQFPLNINKDPNCHVQTDSITLWSAETAIYTSLPPSNHHKKSCKEQLKMKYDIALRQNCDQSATVWWSTRSSA